MFRLIVEINRFTCTNMADIQTMKKEITNAIAAKEKKKI